MNRRHLLALVGASVGSLAGCSGLPPGGTSPTPSETPIPTPDRTRRVSMGQTVTVDEARMTVENPRVRKAVVSRGVHTYVVAGAGQFVVVDVTTGGPAPNQPDDIDLRSSVDGDPLPDGDPLSTVKGEDRYAFPFPAERPETAAIRWATGETRIYWELPASVRETLASEPAFRVEDLDVPRRDGRLALEMTVVNEGDRDGRFKARVSFEGFSGGHIVEFPVLAGESRKYSDRPGGILLYLENDGGGTLTVQFPDEDGLTRVERNVEVPTATESNN